MGSTGWCTFLWVVHLPAHWWLCVGVIVVMGACVRTCVRWSSCLALALPSRCCLCPLGRAFGSLLAPQCLALGMLVASFSWCPWQFAPRSRIGPVDPLSSQNALRHRLTSMCHASVSGTRSFLGEVSDTGNARGALARNERHPSLGMLSALFCLVLRASPPSPPPFPSPPCLPNPSGIGLPMALPWGCGVCCLARSGPVPLLCSGMGLWLAMLPPPPPLSASWRFLR